MRSAATVLSLVLVASPVLAAPSAAIDLAKVPQQCRAVSAIPRSAAIAAPAFSARVSAASCMADGVLADRTLVDDEASIARADAAAAPLMATLDDVVAHGDAREQLVAEYTRGNLLFGLQSRLRASIPPINDQTSLKAAQAIEQRHAMLEPKLARWNSRAIDAFRRVVAIAQANPNVLTRDPVAQYMAQEAARVYGLIAATVSRAP